MILNQTAIKNNHRISIHLIAAARPNFMKIAPLYHSLKTQDWAIPLIIHTGQHYDLNMSDFFFRDLRLPEPDIHLGVGSGTHAEQTGQVMISYEKVLLKKPPDLVVVVGDVNSTMATTIASVKLGIKVAHLEAGLRSFDRTMPEEINRVTTDALAQILWTPSSDADANLIREGISKHAIHRVGNIMMDSLEMLRESIQNKQTYVELGLNPGKYGLITLHRPSNVDDPIVLKSICHSLCCVAKHVPIVFPVHPRAQKNLEAFNLIPLLDNADRLIRLPPLSYVNFMNLLFNCGFSITDSGGIQEETTYLHIPCLTLRPNTERPVTITHGTNQLCTPENIEEKVAEILTGNTSKGSIPELWDGRTASRIVKSIKHFLLEPLR